MATTEVIPYSPAVEVIPPTFTDNKAQRAWVKWQRDKRMIEAAMPALLMIGCVWGLKQMEYNNIMSKPAANLTATACVASIGMQAMPPEAWTTLGNITTAFIDKLPDLSPFGM